MSSKCNVTRPEWDINDTNLPKFSVCQNFEEWADGPCGFVYSAFNEQAKKHSSGWAMRNTNNHNVQILKKSCLGVLICSQNCVLDNGQQVHVRPAICDKARRKQQGKPCPNRNCNGKLQIHPCRGHGGYPVTHFWRHQGDFILFQAKGYHDHPRPEPKNSSDMKRMASLKALKNSSLFTNGYGKRLSSKLKQNNSLSSNNSSIRKPLAPPMLSKCKPSPAPLSNNTSYNRNTTELKTTDKLSSNAINLLPNSLEPNSLAFSFPSLTPNEVSHGNRILSLNGTMHPDSKYLTTNYDHVTTNVNTIHTPACNPKTPAPNALSTNQCVFNPTTCTYHAPFTNAVVTTSCPLTCPTSLHLSSSLSSSTCSSVEINQPPYLHSTAFLAPSSVATTTVNNTVPPMTTSELSASSAPNEVFTNFNYLNTYSTEAGYTDYEDFKQKKLSNDMFTNANYTDDYLTINNHQSNLIQGYYKAKENKCIDPPVFDCYPNQSNYSNVCAPDPKAGSKYMGSDNTYCSADVTSTELTCLSNEAPPTSSLSSQMYPYAATEVDPVHSSYVYPSNGTFETYESQPSIIDAHAESIIDAQFNARTAYIDCDVGRTNGEDQYRMGSSTLASHHYPMEANGFNDRLGEPKGDLDPEHGWTFDQMDMFYTNDIFAFDSSFAVKQDTFTCPPSTYHASALYSALPSVQPISAHLSASDRQPPALCAYNEFIETGNTCNSDDYVVTFLK